ncbi:MAG: hypothetical protein KF730_11855 [Sphingomonas sp.]|nr:hypothetical protein [Sphingomonas sp.]MBX3565254.1 hypothetical protein [Sphingomonas sp.]
MDETVENEAAGEAVLEKPEAAALREADAEPKAYMFDGWGMVPLEL